MIDFIAGLAAIAVIVSLAWGTAIWLIHGRTIERNERNAGVKGILADDNYAQGG